MKNVVGYLTRYHDGYHGQDGQGYNYIFAKNGVFIYSDNGFISARIPIAQCEVRGLAEEYPMAILNKGKIPGSLFDLAYSNIMANKGKETYFAITWDNGYHLWKTLQEGLEAHVEYTARVNTIMDIHSHPNMRAFFSHGDDKDEQGFRLSCIVGYPDGSPEVSVRVGVYGNYLPLAWNDVFDGSLKEIRDTAVVPEVDNHAIPCEDVAQQNNYRRHWWDGLFSL